MARYTGWSEDFILWDLPLSRGHAYAHAQMRMHGIKTRLVDFKERQEVFQKIDE